MSYYESAVKTATQSVARVGYAVMRRYWRWTSDLPDDPDRPWLREYADFGIPETARPFPEEPLHTFLYDAAANSPEGGFHQRGQTVTFPDVLEDAERLATALADRGIQKGDRVASVLPTCVQFVVVDYAISIAGGVHIPNDFLDAEGDLVDRLERGDPDVLIGQDKHRELLFDLRDELGLEEVILTDLDDYSERSPTHDDLDGVAWLPDVIDNAPRDPPDVEFDVTEDVHTLLFTGGTTGRPKGCLLTHRNLTANALQGEAVQDILDFGGSTKLLIALSAFHAAGYAALHGVVHGGDEGALVSDPRDTDEMQRLIEEHGIRVVAGVPTHFMELLEEEIDRNLLGFSGASPLADETRKEFEDEHLAISQAYGLSEMSPGTHGHVRGFLDSIARVDTHTKTGGFDRPCIGVPLPDTEIKLRDVDDQSEMPVREVVEAELEAELCVNGPQRMKGYLDAPDPFDEDGFIPTGDVVMVDPYGRFYVVDRVKNMINVSGLKVYPEEVDEVLITHPGIRRSATVGVPDPDRPGSEQVKVYLDVAPDYDGDLSTETLREFLDGEVSRQALPDLVEVVDELPLTDVGKIDREALKDWHEQTRTQREPAEVTDEDD